MCKNIPDIKRNGHHRVEDDNVGPEREEGGERAIYSFFSREERCEHWPFPHLPDCITNGQNGAHERQETKNLTIKDTHISIFQQKNHKWMILLR